MKRINEYLSVKKAAKFLGVASNTIRNWEKLNKLKAYRNPMNGHRLYCREDLKKILVDICKS